MLSTHPAASHYARRSTIGLHVAIQGVDIRTDAQGRYCLNDLHRAAGGQAKDQPAFFMRRRETADLVAELVNTENVRISVAAGASANSQTPVATLNDGHNNGTYVVKELVYAYAMWISASFHLKVIRAFDELVTSQAAPAFNVPQTLPEALRLAADLADKNASLTATIAEQTPKVEALDRIATSDGSLCITDAAKSLQLKPRQLFAWLSAHQWIYQRPGHSGWIAYQMRIQSGDLEHKVTLVQRSDGSDKVVEQVRVTSKGLSRLAQALRSDLETMQ